MRRSAPKHDPRVVLALMLWAQFAVPLMLFSVGAFAPLLRDALHISREQLGTLMAFYHAGAAAPMLALWVGWQQVFALMGCLILASALSDLLCIAIGRQ
jgi:hypothetical protein